MLFLTVNYLSFEHVAHQLLHLQCVLANTILHNHLRLHIVLSVVVQVSVLVARLQIWVRHLRKLVFRFQNARQASQLFLHGLVLLPFHLLLMVVFKALDSIKSVRHVCRAHLLSGSRRYLVKIRALSDNMKGPVVALLTQRRRAYETFANCIHGMSVSRRCVHLP